MHGMVSIKEVVSKNDFKQFVNFQFDLYKTNEFWIPPLKQEEIKHISADCVREVDYDNNTYTLIISGLEILNNVDDYAIRCFE